MIKTLRRRLRDDRRAGTLTEFALTATALMFVIFGILQGGMMYWTWQALQGAAIDAARCAAINSSSCANVDTAPGQTATAAYAVAAAATRGISGATATATTGTGTTLGCGTSLSVVSVKLSYTMVFYTNFMTPPAMTVQACFPWAG